MAVENVRPSQGGLTLRRAAVGAWFGYAGGLALIAAVVSLLTAGIAAPATLIAFGLFIAGMMGWAAVAPREFRDFFTGRQVRYSTLSVFMTLLLAGIVAIVFVLLWRGNLILDMTEGERFSLSPETRRLLTRVVRPIQITGFYTSSELPIRELDNRYYQLYRDATDGLIQVQYYNPDEVPALAAGFGVTPVDRLFISNLTDRGEVDFSTLARIPQNNQQEREISGAIARLLIAGQIGVYFEEALGERSLLDDSNEGLLGINNGMRESGLRTYSFSLPALAASGGDIPTDAAAVVFARPLADLDDAGVAVLDRYLARGGSLLLLPDVTFTDDAFMREGGALDNYLWTNYGLRALNAAVVDEASNSQTALDLISAYVFYDNDITRRLDPAEGTPAYFRLARALQVNLEFDSEAVANGQLIVSSDQSYAERDLITLGSTNTFAYNDGVDIPGPQAVAAFAYHQQTDARIVLIGDSDFITNGQVNNGGNGILFTDAMAWLVRLNEELEYAPQAFAAGLPLLGITPEQFNLVAAGVAIVLPGAVAGIGLYIGRRRSRG